MDYLVFGMPSTNLVVTSCRNEAQIYCFYIEMLGTGVFVGVFFVWLVGFLLCLVSVSWGFIIVVKTPKYC